MGLALEPTPYVISLAVILENALDFTTLDHMSLEDQIEDMGFPAVLVYFPVWCSFLTENNLEAWLYGKRKLDKVFVSFARLPKLAVFQRIAIIYSDNSTMLKEAMELINERFDTFMRVIQLFPKFKLPSRSISKGFDLAFGYSRFLVDHLRYDLYSHDPGNFYFFARPSFDHEHKQLPCPGIVINEEEYP